MRRTGLLHAELLAVVGGMGHGDFLVIADAGLPVPSGVRRIDLAVREGMPPFMAVVETVLGELVVESAVLATQTEEQRPELAEALRAALRDVGVSAVSCLPHDEFKLRCAGARAVVRTGECTPYANVLLVAGVPF
ncbi:MAG: D-ribose pyranase [Thermaerobacter sp.]|nr:D-ribose pyranase [Thermaerobacter sp.]